MKLILSLIFYISFNVLIFSFQAKAIKDKLPGTVLFKAVNLKMALNGKTFPYEELSICDNGIQLVRKRNEMSVVFSKFKSCDFFEKGKNPFFRFNLGSDITLEIKETDKLEEINEKLKLVKENCESKKIKRRFHNKRRFLKKKY